LSSASRIVGEATTGQEAVELATSLQPDVVLIDLRMPDLNGIEATRRIHRTSPHISILVLTVFEDDTSIFPAIRAGARGYLLKDAQQEELLSAIRAVASGGAIFSPGIAQKVLRYLRRPSPDPSGELFDELSARERDILELIARGKTNTEIA
jgi:DNA-binding NarL/FixJ family response regulator